MKDSILHTRINKELLEQLKQKAKEENRTLSNLVETRLLNNSRTETEIRNKIKEMIEVEDRIKQRGELGNHSELEIESYKGFIEGLKWVLNN